MSETRRSIDANGLSFLCREAGVEGGEPVVLLHGFPESSAMWRPLTADLAERGYRTLAPDQRGYSPGARPDGVNQYAAALLASDVIALAGAAGLDRFHLVGHDWGAAVGWAVAAAFPERVASWTALSVAHPAAFGRALREDPAQQAKSAYIQLLVQPGIAEQTLSENGFAVLRSLFTDLPAENVEEYVSVLSQPGALTAALNWYRAAFGPDAPSRDAVEARVAVPTLMIWGSNDVALGRSTTEGAERYMDASYRFVELDAGHWLVQEQFAAVRDEIVAHLAQHPIGTPAS